MKQADLGLSLTTKRTRKREFLAQMERVVPWAALVELLAPHVPEGKKGRPPYPVQTMLRIHFKQQWFTLSDPAIEEALHHIALFREFAGLGREPSPHESFARRGRAGRGHPHPQVCTTFVTCIGIGAGHPASLQVRTMASLVSK